MDSKLISFESPILEAIAIIQSSKFKIALVLDRAEKLIGTVTDGDVRRALLAGKSLSDPVSLAMNSNPVYLSQGEISSLSERDTHGLQFVPIVNEYFKPIAIYESSLSNEKHQNDVILMAGGKGTRLLPHTRNIPKPLVEIDGVPLIDSLIIRFASQGFLRIRISVGHMAEQIIDHLGDGSKLGVQITYLHENEPLGTAGALGELKGKLGKSTVVANADLFTSCDFRSMLNFHESLGGGLTIGLRDYSHQVPFGVVEIQNTAIVGLVEKPSIVQKVAAGIYCLSPAVVDSIEKGQYLDMPALAGKLISTGEAQVNGFPIHEQWDDVGRPEDLMRLRAQQGGKIAP